VGGSGGAPVLCRVLGVGRASDKHRSRGLGSKDMSA